MTKIDTSVSAAKPIAKRSSIRNTLPTQTAAFGEVAPYNRETAG